MKKDNDLMDSIKGIKTKEQLSTFILELKGNFVSSPDTWENLSLESYFDSIAAWIEVMETQYDDLDALEKENKWQTIAKIFYIGKIYE